jgi:2-polyprenyl-3-methyl-5-hydroxy-6-metoxy-1,4-benzoquinol methylase
MILRRFGGPRAPSPVSIPAGHYAQKQLLSRSALVRWSHGSRFRLARTLVTPFAGHRLLDFGCGDGTFLGLVQDIFPDAVGADADAEQIADCASRFAAQPGISWLTTDRLADRSHVSRYDVVVCMEVLEHCPDDVQGVVLDQIQSVAASSGTIVFSVPIEIVPPLIAKQCARALAAMRVLGEYSSRERYRPHELARMLCAGRDTVFPRQEFSGSAADGRQTRFTGHKGFNWRALERRLEDRFEIQRRLFSPMAALGPWMNSQVWFICRNPQQPRQR